MNENNDGDLYTLNVHKNVSPPNHQLPPIKKAKRTGRGRSRRSQMIQPPSSSSPSSPENNIDRIFIWYIDETILSYLTVSEYNRFTGFNVSFEKNLRRKNEKKMK